MLTTPADIYAFGPFLLDRRRRRLEKNGVAVGLRPKVFDLLVALIEQAGHDVDKEERRVPPDVVDVLIEYVRRKPSPFTIVALQQFHGAAARVAPHETAFAHRGDRFDCLILAQWASPADGDANIAWARELWGAVEPHVDAAVYVNNLGDEPDAVVRAAYGPNYSRLASIKAKYDPANVFRSTQNVLPLGDMPPAP